MADDKPPMPPQPTTKQLPAVTVPQNQIDAILVEVRQANTSLGLLTGQVRSVEARMGGVESRVAELEQRQDKSSIRAQEPSQHDLAAQTAIAEEKRAREERDEQLAKDLAEVKAKVAAIYDTVVGVVTNKKVIFVGKVVFALAVAYSGLHGLKVLP